MKRTITISEALFLALQHLAEHRQESVDSLAEIWLKQLLRLDRYPGLEWREAVGGWRVGLKDTAIDVYTIVGYIHSGATPAEIANELLPQLSLDQVRVALRYYADFPEEIDRILAESVPEAIKARLYRTLGPQDYYRLTGTTQTPHRIREDRAKYQTDE